MTEIKGNKMRTNHGSLVLRIGLVSALFAVGNIPATWAQTRQANSVGRVNEGEKTKGAAGSPADVDRTAEPVYWCGYEPNQTYETTTDLLYDGHRLGSVYVRNYLVEIAEYKSNPKAYPEISLLPSGTRFQIVQVTELRRITFKAISLTGQFSDGPLRKKRFYILSIPELKTAKQTHKYRNMYPSETVRKIPVQQPDRE